MLIFHFETPTKQTFCIALPSKHVLVQHMSAAQRVLERAWPTMAALGQTHVCCDDEVSRHVRLCPRTPGRRDETTRWRWRWRGWSNSNVSVSQDVPSREMEKTIKGDVRQTFFRSRQCLKPRLNGIMNVYSRQCRSVLSVCRLGSGCVRIQRRGRTEMARSRMLLLLAGVMPCVVLVEHGWSCSPRCKDVFLLESLHRCVPVR
jgi:hypothetical protein